MGADLKMLGAPKRLRSGRIFQLFCATFLLPLSAAAQPVVYESEPNNTPAEANAVSGAVTIMGDLEGKDQDAFMWNVSDVDAQKRWTVELEGIPGTLTLVDVFRLEFADNGVDVAAKHSLFKVGSRDGTKPGRVEDLLFEPGEYLLGVASAGSTAGSYRLHLRHGKKLSLAGRPPKNPTQDSAHKLRLGTEYAAFIETPESWFQFEIKDADASQLWVVRAQFPIGQKAQVRVRDRADKVLTQASVGPRGGLTSSDLDLGAGTYFIEVGDKTAGSIRTMVVEAIGPRIEGGGAETTGAAEASLVTKGSWKLANRVE